MCRKEGSSEYFVALRSDHTGCSIKVLDGCEEII
jgi:hypothetical protein